MLTHRPRHLSPALGLLLSAASGVACSEAPPPATPAHRAAPAAPAAPAATIVTADFSAIFAAQTRSRSVYMPSRDAEWSKRILLGPNLVFEASRTSLGDSPVTGPSGAAAPAPDQKDALGAAIDIPLSTTLLTYLAAKGSTVLAPAVTRRWSPEWWCAKDSCSAMTWVERVLLAHHAKGGGGKDGPRVEVRAEELPTAMLAVRRLGRTMISAEVIAEQSGATLAYRFRRSPEETSVCPAATFQVPVLVFSAEIVSARDGRILARLDETRQLVAPAQTQAQIEAIVPVLNQEAVNELRLHADAVERGRWDVPAPVLPYWLQGEVRCKNGEEAYHKLAQRIAAQGETEQEAAAAQMVAKALDPLFEVAPDEKAPKGKARGAGKSR